MKCSQRCGIIIKAAFVYAIQGNLNWRSIFVLCMFFIFFWGGGRGGEGDSNQSRKIRVALVLLW